MKRIGSIDFARGFVMIIMALDHVRDLIHVDSAQSPTNLATTSPGLFFTRWITYLCAPTFVFLAGLSAYLYSTTHDIAQTRRYLVTRGIWLILLEFTLVNFGMFFDVGFHTIIFEVIAAIGVGFVILSLILGAGPMTIGITGVIILFCHDLFPMIPFAEGSITRAVLEPLLSLKVFTPGSGTIFIMAYPPIPWLGIVLVGYAAGKLFDLGESVRRERFVLLGGGLLFFFVLLRATNLYGDPVPWSSQKDMLYTVLSFMNVTKYPPSLLFCSVTLGVMFLTLAWATRASRPWMNVVTVYGHVPLFYFLLHFYLIHIILVITMLVQGFTWDQLNFASGGFGRPAGVTSGLSLAAVYWIWIAVVVVLYKPCLWFGQYKARSQEWWLKYF